MKMKKLHFLITIIAMVSAMHSTAQQSAKAAKSGNPATAVVYTTAENTDLKLSPIGTLTFKDFGQPLETQVCIFVDPAHKFQTLLGIGGAITDAAAETFAKLPEARQKELITAYYDPQKGIGYSLARTTIHSSDFSSRSYTYVDDNDASLKSFTVAHDQQFRIPMIKKALAEAGGKLTIFASPWSPPAWMKTNNNMLKGGKLKPEYFQSWANYFVKFIRSYEKLGIPIWGVTVQNEPMATQTWESCIFSADDELNFVKNYMGPTFQKSGLASKKIVMWDHNRDLMYQRASTYFSDPVVSKYVWGIGFHWYEDWSGGDQMFDNVRRVYEAFPDKHLLFTEGCAESFDASRYSSWSLGEEYGRSMIHDFNNGSSGFTDWNVLLDENGGPNHVGNFCFAPVHADTQKGELIYTNSYYYIGHFSKFIKPGAKRIAVASSRSQLIATAFQNPDGKVAVVVMNQTDKEVPYNIWVAGKAVSLSGKPHSIDTIVF